MSPLGEVSGLEVGPGNLLGPEAAWQARDRGSPQARQGPAACPPQGMGVGSCALLGWLLWPASSLRLHVHQWEQPALLWGRAWESPTHAQPRLWGRPSPSGAVARVLVVESRVSTCCRGACSCSAVSGAAAAQSSQEPWSAFPCSPCPAAGWERAQGQVGQAPGRICTHLFTAALAPLGPRPLLLSHGELALIVLCTARHRGHNTH